MKREKADYTFVRVPHRVMNHRVWSTFRGRQKAAAFRLWVFSLSEPVPVSWLDRKEVPVAKALLERGLVRFQDGRLIGSTDVPNGPPANASKRLMASNSGPMEPLIGTYGAPLGTNSEDKEPHIGDKELFSACELDEIANKFLSKTEIRENKNKKEQHRKNARAREEPDGGGVFVPKDEPDAGPAKDAPLDSKPELREMWLRVAKAITRQFETKWNDPWQQWPHWRNEINSIARYCLSGNVDPEQLCESWASQALAAGHRPRIDFLARDPGRAFEANRGQRRANLEETLREAKQRLRAVNERMAKKEGDYSDNLEEQVKLEIQISKMKKEIEEANGENKVRYR